MKEKLKKELEKLKKMTFKQKLQYIWEYYKIGILVILFAAVFIGMLIRDMGKNNPDAVHIAMCDMLTTGLLSDDTDGEASSEAQLNDSFIAFWGMDTPKKLPLSVDTSYSLNVADDYMATMMRQKLIAALGAQMIDVMIGSEDGVKEFATMNAFVDIREYLSEETVSALESKNLICKAKVTPDSASGGEPYEVYYGVKADNMTVLTDAGYVTDGCAAAITGNPEKRKTAEKVMEMLVESIK